MTIESHEERLKAMDVRFSKRKTLSLQITDDGALIVRAPNRTSKKSIQTFVNNHQAWIDKQQAKIAKRQAAQLQGYHYLGTCYALITTDKINEPICLNDKFLLNLQYAPQKETVLNHWYKQQASALVERRINALSKKTGLAYQSFSLSKAKTYWGICTADNHLRIHWALIKGPIETLDYVITHELAHTKIKNHSKHFWALVQQHCPDYKTHEALLKDWPYGR